MFQFVNRLYNVGQSGMPLLLFEGTIDHRSPALGQLLEGADVQVAVVKEGFELGHVLDQKTPILANGIATHR